MRQGIVQVPRAPRDPPNIPISVNQGLHAFKGKGFREQELGFRDEGLGKPNIPCLGSIYVYRPSFFRDPSIM